MRYHAVRRTSPTGKGMPFIGTCFQCGMSGLGPGAALEECENPAGLSQDDALIMAIEDSPPAPAKRIDDGTSGGKEE